MNYTPGFVHGKVMLADDVMAHCRKPVTLTSEVTICTLNAGR